MQSLDTAQPARREGETTKNDKFVILTHEFFPFRGGVATYCSELASAGVTSGRQVEVWASGKAPLKTNLGYKVRWLAAGARLHPLDLIRFARVLRKRREELASSVVVLASVGAQMAWMLAGRIATAGVVVVFHGSEILKFARWPWRGKSVRLVRNSSRVVCVSRAVADRFRRGHLGRCALDRIVLAPGAPSKAMEDLARTVKTPAHDDGLIRILTLARLHPRKGQLQTARALGLLPQALKPKVVYWIAGTGDDSYWHEVREALDASGVRWKAFGEVSDHQAAELYAGCDFYVMSSMEQAGSIEGLGITYLEAALFGKPSVAFATGGAVEAVLEGETGLVAPEGDVKALSECLRRLMEDGDLRQSLGQAARRHGAAFTWKTAAERVLQSD